MLLYQRHICWKHHAGQAGKRRKKDRPDRSEMSAVREEKDTADKRINYFINFTSQLTLHATFQVSQPVEDERCWAAALVTPHQLEKKNF